MLKQDLGKLESVYVISSAFLQRAAVVAAVSFVFFLVMIIAFYIRQNIGYFLLATAFLVIEIFTLIGWFIQRETELKIYQNGLTYKKQLCGWDEIKSVSIATAHQKVKCEIRKNGGEKIVLTELIAGINEIIKTIETKIARQ